MSVKKYEKLFELLEPSILGPSNKTDSRKICKEERLVLTLRYLITGQSMRSLEMEFFISHCTISKIISEVCSSIWKILKPLVFPVLTKDKFKEIASGFQAKHKIPHCIGAIDGKHVEIQALIIVDQRFTTIRTLLVLC